MRRRRWLVLALCAVAATSGCANIPEYSNPHAVIDSNAAPREGVPGPTAGLNPADLVREYVNRSGNPDAARSYLTADAQSRWRGGDEPIIIHEVFGARPQPAKVRKQEGDRVGGDDTQSVLLEMTKIGRLGSDQAFVPAVGTVTEEVTVRRENGEWRIAEPPDAVYVPTDKFEASYRAVTVYYFDRDLRITVPDLRYVQDQPQSGLPARVISTLLSGPSDTLRGSVVSPLQGVETRTNVVNNDGAIVVDLNPPGDLTKDQRNLIAAQIVMSLRDVNSFGAPVRLMIDGQDLVAGHRDWLPTEIEDYAALATPPSDLSGMVAADGRLRSLDDNADPIPGPAGDGTYHVQSAAQSIDGEMLAVVEQTDTGARLRVGRVGEPMQVVEQIAEQAVSTLTRPTWMVSTSPQKPTDEVWTVADGKVVRVVQLGDGTWKPLTVNATAMTSYGQITELRLSRDGTRVAAVAAGGLVVASVVREDDESVSLEQPRQLVPQMIVRAVDVDWLDQKTLVVAADQAQLSVMNVSVDGRQLAEYDTSNLRLPVSAVTAAPGKNIAVTDSLAVSTAPDREQLWRQHPRAFGPTAIPFYPG
jgi:lipoprotein LpqB-like beta-propeller protein/sporulation and spore germination protein